MLHEITNKKMSKRFFQFQVAFGNERSKSGWIQVIYGTIYFEKSIGMEGFSILKPLILKGVRQVGKT